MSCCSVVSKLLSFISAWFQFFIIFILLSIPLTLLGLYRILVTVVLRRCFRRDLIATIPEPDRMFSIDDIWNHPLCSIAAVLTLDGPLNLKCFQDRFAEVIHGLILHKNETMPNYERLTSIGPTSWLGFHFWTKVKNSFDLQRHLTVYPQAGTLTKSEAVNVLKKWFAGPFVRERPLWDTIIIQDFVGEDNGGRTLFAFRAHHIIGDGYSIRDFLGKLFDGYESLPSPSPAFKKMSLLHKFRMWAWMPLTAKKQIRDYFLNPNYFVTEKEFSGDISYFTTTIALSQLKGIRNRMSLAISSPVSMTTVILFMIASALHKAVDRDSVYQGKGDWNSMAVGMALPRATPNPPGQFINHWSQGVYTVPVGKMSPIDRLRKMVDDVASQYACGAFEMNFNCIQLCSVLPGSLYAAVFNRIRGAGILMANLQGLSHPVMICGRNVVDHSCIMGFLPNVTSFSLVCSSYNQKMTISINAKSEIFDDKACEKILGEYFQKGIKNFLKSGFQGLESD